MLPIFRDFFKKTAKGWNLSPHDIFLWSQSECSKWNDFSCISKTFFLYFILLPSISTLFLIPGGGISVHRQTATCLSINELKNFVKDGSSLQHKTDSEKVKLEKSSDTKPRV
jgi:hypothetical protein